MLPSAPQGHVNASCLFCAVLYVTNFVMQPCSIKAPSSGAEQHLARLCRGTSAVIVTLALTVLCYFRRSAYDVHMRDDEAIVYYTTSCSLLVYTWIIQVAKLNHVLGYLLTYLLNH